MLRKGNRTSGKRTLTKESKRSHYYIGLIFESLLLKLNCKITEAFFYITNDCIQREQKLYKFCLWEKKFTASASLENSSIFEF